MISTVGIVALIAAAGYALWTLWAPLQRGWRLVTERRPANQMSFVVVGDNHGLNPIYGQIMSTIRGERYDFLLNLADTSEYGQRQEFTTVKQTEARLPFPTYHVLGSHDIKTDPSGKTFADVFGRQPCSSLVVRGLRLILLNNADRKVGFPDDCLDWFEAELDAHPRQPTILAYHRPFNLPLSSLLGDDETPSSRRTNERFLAIVRRHSNIAYMFTAHLHTYLPYTLAGVPAVVSGGGGDPAQSILGGPANNFFHYLVVRVNGADVRLDVRRVQLTEATAGESSPR